MGEAKDVKVLFAKKKKKEVEENITLELSFVDSYLTMFKLHKKMEKVKEEIVGFNNVRAYNDNFGDYIF